MSDDEWDIERAIENRVVQVMFTVPKEKLRVVNHDFEEERSEVGSVRSMKSSGRRSVKDLFGIGEEDEKGAEAAEPLLEDMDEKDDAALDEKSEPRGSRGESPRSKDKGKGKVLEIVEKIERRASPERSPDRS
jgi:hypothetical protein